MQSTRYWIFNLNAFFIPIPLQNGQFRSHQLDAKRRDEVKQFASELISVTLTKKKYCLLLNRLKEFQSQPRQSGEIQRAFHLLCTVSHPQPFWPRIYNFDDSFFLLPIASRISELIDFLSLFYRFTDRELRVDWREIERQLFSDCNALICEELNRDVPWINRRARN